MPKAKKIFLLHERREIWRFRFGKKRNAFCDQCGQETAWLDSAEAAMVSDMSDREIFRLAENDQIHFTESHRGLLLFCGRSLEAVS